MVERAGFEGSCTLDVARLVRHSRLASRPVERAGRGRGRIPPLALRYRTVPLTLHTPPSNDVAASQTCGLRPQGFGTLYGQGHIRSSVFTEELIILRKPERKCDRARKRTKEHKSPQWPLEAIRAFHGALQALLAVHL